MHLGLWLKVHNDNSILLWAIIVEQECIPVGCVPSAAVAGCWGGGAWSGGCPVWGVASQHALRQTPPPCGQTDSCKNITFATLLRTVINRKDFFWLQLLPDTSHKRLWQFVVTTKFYHNISDNFYCAQMKFGARSCVFTSVSHSVHWGGLHPGGLGRPPQSDTMGYGKWMGGMHPTGIHSCIYSILIVLVEDGFTVKFI